LSELAIEGQKEDRGEMIAAGPQKVPRVILSPIVPRRDRAPDRVVPTHARVLQVPNFV
jgi:hypothetical protein